MSESWTKFSDEIGTSEEWTSGHDDGGKELSPAEFTEEVRESMGVPSKTIIDSVEYWDGTKGKGPARGSCKGKGEGGKATPADDRDVGELLKEHGFDEAGCKRIMDLGVEKSADLAFVSEEDLEGCGLTTIQRRRFLQVALEVGRHPKGKGHKGGRYPAKGGKAGSGLAVPRTGLPARSDHAVLASIAEDEEIASRFDVGKLRSDTFAFEAATMETLRRKRDAGIKGLVKAMSQAQRVCLCFVVDTTGSMQPYIDGVKTQIAAIVEQIKHAHCHIAGLAFVGYKDWSEGDHHFEVLPFTTDPEQFAQFVGRVRAGGGGDEPEDVVGGLNQALILNWPASGGTNVIFHVADAPPHGKQYHNMSDNFPSGHGKDVSLHNLFMMAKRKSVQYYFGKVNQKCDQMLEIFEKECGETITSFNIKDVLTLTRSVTSSVMESIAATGAVACSCSGDTTTSLSRIREYVLDPAEPIWDDVPKVSVTVSKMKLPETAQDIWLNTKLQSDINKGLIQIAPCPFAKGGERLAYLGRRFFHQHDEASGLSKEVVDEVVLKEYIKLPTVPELDRSRYMVANEVQNVATRLSLEFNDHLERGYVNPGIKLKFLIAKVVKLTAPDGRIRFLAMEKKYRSMDEFVKLTNNYKMVRAPESKEQENLVNLAVAFSHFSHSQTRGYCLVCDLQGMVSVDSKDQPTLLLTDPAIHCPSSHRFGRTNLGESGIAAFFDAHKCNKYCKALGLEEGGKMHDTCRADGDIRRVHGKGGSPIVRHSGKSAGGKSRSSAGSSTCGKSESGKSRSYAGSSK